MEMTILHIAHVGESRLAGVNVAVPAMVRAQEAAACVGFLNLTNAAVPEVASQLAYTKGMKLEDLPEPFCKPDLIVFHELYRPPFLSLSKQARARGIPYVIVPHGGLTAGAQRIKAWKKIPANGLLFNRFIRGAEAIQCLSQREMDQSGTDVPKFIGTNGIEPGEQKTAFSQQGMRLVYVGRLGIQIKGLDLMMEALGAEKTFLREHRCRIDLYGPDEAGARKWLLEARQRLGLEEVLDIHDAVTGPEKRRVLREADGYIQTSRSEGMSMGILEALAWGLPCLVTQGTGMAELVESRRAGWGCGTDAAAIAAALRRAVSDREQLAALSGNARALVQERFTWKQAASETLAQYERLLGLRNRL